MYDIITFIMATVFFVIIGIHPPWQSKKIQDSNKEVQDIPGPVAVPVLGTAWLFLLGVFQVEKIPDFYIRMREKYGSIVKEEALFNVPVISVYERTDIEKVLRSTGKWPIRPPTEAIAKYRSEHPERYSSTGLVNEQGEKWNFLRTTLTPALTSPKTIKDFLPELQEIADDWCHLIKQKRNSHGLIDNLEDLASRLGLEAICALVLGRRMGFLIEERKSQTAENLARAVHENFIACRDTYFGLPLWKLFPTTAYKKLCHSEETIYTIVEELVRCADDSIKDSAVIQSVLRADIDDREKRSAIVDFLAAGIHTLKNSLLLFLCQIGRSPECQMKILQDETKSYLKACQMETFRLSSTIHVLARITEHDLVLSGYHVPAGTVVLCQTAHACQNEANFKDATSFLPERWLDDRKSETSSTAAFLVNPFGYGKRICPGKRFIEQALPIIIEKMVREFVIDAKDPLETRFEFLVAPKAPVSMSFQDRL
ncbi:hypothetical protein ABEB36_011659 [Hypothenemus hampei]|uniref:Ecdysone 20-monooxygenase n=1 Tax=Hypothenemus hampei TaxID=57062 RepID=A0ABD1EAP0_HYPHA